MAFGHVSVWICHKSFETWSEFVVNRVLYLRADFVMVVVSSAVAGSHNVVSFAVVWLEGHVACEGMRQDACCVAHLCYSGAESVSSEERCHVCL